jgi:hypothetical protein
MEAEFTSAGRREEFLAHCEEAQRRHAEAGITPKLNQWYLEPARPSDRFRELIFADEFDGPAPRPEWQWHDPSGASAYSLLERPGCLTIRSAQGSDLWPASNLNAPRLLLEVRGDVALEARVEADWADEHQCASGILFWRDSLNFARLEKRSMSENVRGQIELDMRIDGHFSGPGRGCLQGASFVLRLERTGERVVALCRADEGEWLTCGQVLFPVRDPIWVGIDALGGMIARFEYVRLFGARWRRPEDARPTEARDLEP